MVVDLPTPHRFNESRLKKTVDEVKVVKLLPGEVYSSNCHEEIVTILGSCVATCLWDPITKVGGMNHFMLPEAKKQQHLSSPNRSHPTIKMLIGRYGNFAMYYLIEELLEKGAYLHNLQAKLFGGAKMIKHMTNIGKKNAEFALDYLQEAEIPVVASHLYGTCARKIAFEPWSGIVKVKELSNGNP